MTFEHLSFKVTADMDDFNRAIEKSTEIIERFNAALTETERLTAKIGGTPPKSGANSRGRLRVMKLPPEI